MDKDDLLRRAHEALYMDHGDYSLEMGDAIPIRSKYHKKLRCVVCDLLRDIDKELEPPRNRCCGLPGYHKPSDGEYVIHPL